MFPWLFMLLEVVHCSLCIEEAVTSSTLYWLVSGEKYLPSALLGILRTSSDLFIMLTSYFFFPLVKEFLRLCTFPWSCRASSGADGLPFTSPRVVLNAHICRLSPNPAKLGWLLYILTSLQRLVLAVLRGLHKEPTMKWGCV